MELKKVFTQVKSSRVKSFNCNLINYVFIYLICFSLNPLYLQTDKHINWLYKVYIHLRVCIQFYFYLFLYFCICFKVMMRFAFIVPHTVLLVVLVVVILVLFILLLLLFLFFFSEICLSESGFLLLFTLNVTTTCLH